MSEAKLSRVRHQLDVDYNSRVFDTPVGDPEDPSDNRTMQQFVEECDVNTIMARYESRGDLTHIYEAVAQYGDFSDVLDYREGIHQIMEAEASFMELPAKVRDKFNNDPAKFIEFATDEKNLDEMRSMGLAPNPPSDPVVPITRKDLEEVLGGPPAEKK